MRMKSGTKLFDRVFQGKIARNLRWLRESRNWTQRDLADAMKRTTPLVSAWERAVSRPSMEDLWKLADLYCVSLDDLVGRDFRGSKSGATGPEGPTETVGQPGTTAYGRLESSGAG